MQTNLLKYMQMTFLLALIGAMSVSGLLSSCSKDDDKGSDKIELFSYGPMPIARGAELRFIGNNLDKVTQIVLPGDITIESSEFTKRTADLLAITVPQNAVEGFVVLKTPEGDITTKTAMGFSEPISIAAFTPAAIKAGAELTITGDYLNLVGEVIFTDRVAVDSSDFVSKSRTEIKLIVPAQAQSGKLAISNGADDPIIVYSESLLSVVLPAFAAEAALSPASVKAGTLLTITGTNLDLVQEIAFGNNKVVNEFSSHSATKIEVVVPIDAKDGKVTLIPASKVAVASSAILTMLKPTLSVAPSTVKNGSVLTVTGTNLDLITTVTFGGGKVGTLVAGGTSTTIEVNIPEDAIDGTVAFSTKSTEDVLSAALTFVKPVFTSFAPTTCKANNDITITGSDLDLVKEVIFEGGVKGAIGSRTLTQLVVTVPVGAKDGNIQIIAKNGESVVSAGSLTVPTNLPVITSFSEAKAAPGKILTINGSNLLLVKELIFPGNLTATAYGLKSDSKVEVYVPSQVTPGMGKIMMVTYEGEQGYTPDIFMGSVDQVVNPALCYFNFDSKNSWWGNAINSGTMTDAAASADGSTFWNVNGISSTGGWDGLFFRNGSNDFSTTGVTINGWAVRFDINVREAISTGVLKVRLGSYFYDFKPWDGMAGGYKTNGWVTVTCPLTGFYDGATQLSNPSDGGTEFGMAWSSTTAVNVNLGIDNVRFEAIP